MRSKKDIHKAFKYSNGVNFNLWQYIRFSLLLAGAIKLALT